MLVTVNYELQTSVMKNIPWEDSKFHLLTSFSTALTSAKNGKHLNFLSFVLPPVTTVMNT